MEGFQANAGWVCRRDIGRCCAAAIARGVGSHILHVVGTAAGQGRYCNVGETEALLGVRFANKVRKKGPRL